MIFKNKYHFLCSKDGSLWKTTKNILAIKDQPFHLKKAAFSDVDKANTFGKHLSEIFTPHHDIIPEPCHLNQITNFLSSTLPMSFPTKHTFPNEIKNLIQKLKIKKSPGHDQITNKILQHLPKKINNSSYIIIQFYVQVVLLPVNLKTICNHTYPQIQQTKIRTLLIQTN
jgi:hypothetical protein